METNSSSLANVPAFAINLREIPPFLDAEGVRKYLAPLGRTLLYELASQGEIETASLGLKRGKRVFLTASVAAWLQRRIATTRRPQLAHRNAAKQPNP